MRNRFILALIGAIVFIASFFVYTHAASASTSTPDDAHPHCYAWVRGSNSLNNLPAPYTATQECFDTVANLNAAFTADGFTKVATAWDDDHSPVRTLDFVTKLSTGCYQWGPYYFTITNFGSGGWNNAIDEIAAPNGSPTCVGMILYGGINYGGAYSKWPSGHWDLRCSIFCDNYANWTTSLVIGTG